MAIYKYVARDINAKKITGKTEARDEHELSQLLRVKDMYLISHKDITKEETKNYKMKLKELANFCREIGTMMNSGLPLIRTVSILASREDNKKLKAIYNDIYVKLQQGQTLSDALKEQGKAFPDILIQMVRSGEASGNMQDTMMVLNNQFTNDNKIKNKVKSAMTYPVILGIVTIVVLLFVYTDVLPSCFSLFEGMELPLITEINIIISKFIMSYWYALLIGILVLILIIVSLLQLPKVKYQFDRFKLKMPIIGKLMKIIYTSRFARTLCSLYSSGISIVNAMVIVKSTIGNKYIETQFDNSIKAVRNGEALSVAIGMIDGFDIKLTSSVYIGEESGNLEDLLSSLADDFDYEAMLASEKMVAILEPAMIIVLAVVICVIIISVLVPIYSMYQNVGSM